MWEKSRTRLCFHTAEVGSATLRNSARLKDAIWGADHVIMFKQLQTYPQAPLARNSTVTTHSLNFLDRLSSKQVLFQSFHNHYHG